MTYMNNEFFAKKSTGNKSVGMPRPISPADSRRKLFIMDGYSTFNSGTEAAKWLYEWLRAGYSSPASDALKNLAHAGDFQEFLAEFERETARNVDERINPFVDGRAQV